MPRLRSDQVDALIASYAAGATVYELADQFSVNRKTVSRALHRKQVPMRMAGLKDHQIEEAARLYDDCWSLSQIGERMRVDARTVHRRLQERDVPMRDTHGRDR